LTAWLIIFDDDDEDDDDIVVSPVSCNDDGGGGGGVLQRAKLECLLPWLRCWDGLQDHRFVTQR